MWVVFIHLKLGCCLVTHILKKKTFFCVQQKEVNTGMEQKEGE